MINGENEKDNNKHQNISDLNDLFQRTYEFDIFKYVSRGLIKSQQNYEAKLKELILANIKTKEEISLLKKEIELLKENKNYQNSENKDVDSNLDKDIQNLTEGIEKKKQDINDLTKIDNNEGGYNNINLNIETHPNNNNKKQNGKSFDNIKEENYYSEDVEEKKFNYENNSENSNELMIKMSNTYINELVNENNIKQKEESNYPKEKMNYQNTIYLEKFSNEFNNELISIKSKLEEIEKELIQFKLTTNQTISESNNNLKSDISENLLKIKEESKKELNSLSKDIDQKINSLSKDIEQKINLLNDTTKNLTEKNEENEKSMNKTNSLYNSLLGKLNILNTKFVDYLSNADFEKYKNSINNKIEVENKDVNLDISMLKKSVNSLRNEILSITSDTTDHDSIIYLKQRQESILGLIEHLKEIQKESEEKEKKEIIIDTSKFVVFEIFNEYQKNQAKILEKIKRENIDLGRELTEIKLVDLCNKTNFKDLKNLEDIILIKMEELMNNIKERFVEKKSLEKYFKNSDYKTKVILEEFKSELKPNKNWLLAKKPIGHLCASCETYLGEIAQTPKEKSTSWNKYSSKASGDNKNIKLGVGFSKIIQMINNNEKEKFIPLSVSRTNIYNGRNKSSINKKRNEENDDISNINMSSNLSKINKVNLENNNSFQADEYETDIFNGSLPQIKKKAFNQNFSNDKKLLKSSIKSFRHLKRNNKIEEKSDFMIMMNAEKRKRSKIEFGPKITKILKKYNKNNDIQLNNESKKSNEG